MLSYFKWRHDTKEMIRYRERAFKNLEAMIEIHNIIVERPDEVRLSVMQLSLDRINSQIEFFSNEIIKLEGIIKDFNGHDLNRYGKALYNNYMALKQDISMVMDVLRELAKNIEEQIKLK